jgi:DNA-binding beta-propeller fold protein YncE
VKIADTITGRIAYYNGALYATGGYYGSQYVRKLSTTDFKQESANFVTDGTSITMPYGINVDPANGDVYITDAKDYVTSGEVFCFDKNGKKKFSFSTTPAVNPSTIVFIK